MCVRVKSCHLASFFGKLGTPVFPGLDAHMEYVRNKTLVCFRRPVCAT